MELIIAMVLFFALVACWIVLPGSTDSAKAHSVASQPIATVRRV